MANRFYVSPPNILESLMLGAQGFEGGRQRAKDAEYKEIGQEIAAGGGLNSNVLGRIMGMGPQGAPLLMAASALGKADTTDEIKEYNFDSRQRRERGDPVLPFGEWKTGLKLAGATKINNAVNTGDNAYEKKVNEHEANRFIDWQKGAQKAQSKLDSLGVMEGATNDPNFYSGVGAERFVLPIKQGIAAFGGDPKAAASMETFRAQASKATIDSLGSLGTGVSNADRDYVNATNPTLANTPEGNRELIGINRKLAQREIEVAKMAREYAKRNGGKIDAGFDEVLRQHAEKNPLFPPRAPAAAQPATPPASGGFSPPRDWSFSPSRKQFRDPSGKIYDMNGNPI